MNEPHRSNLTSTERGVKKLLQAKEELRHTVGDKCGSFVVMPHTMDKILTNEVLSNDTVYEESSLSALESVCKRVMSVISIVRKRTSPGKTTLRYGLSSAMALYNLEKTQIRQNEHYDPPWTEIKTRPIIASCGGPVDGLSILYANVITAGAVRAVLSLIEDDKDHITMMEFSLSETKDIVEAALGCNTFCSDNKFYRQKQGLAVSNRIAPVLAVIFLDHIEKSSLTSGILYWKRYIDDVFITGTTGEDLVEALKRPSSHNAILTFIREDPERAGFLPVSM
ncbi:hypothetical protein V3C99_002395 [Haemonchus contortus]